jgi:hypothetical protein
MRSPSRSRPGTRGSKFSEISFQVKTGSVSLNVIMIKALAEAGEPEKKSTSETVCSFS